MGSLRRQSRPIIAGCLIAGFLLVDIGTARCLYGPERLFHPILFGICFGQFNLIATWAAVAPGNVFFRLPWSLLLTVLSWYGFVVGHRLQYSYCDGA